MRGIRKGVSYLTFFFLVVDAITGILLMWYYTPSIKEAYSSIVEIENVFSFGAFLRSLHYFSTHFLVASVFFHFTLVVFFTKDIAGANFFKWMGGFAAFIIALLLAFSGKILPMDGHAGVSAIVARGFGDFWNLSIFSFLFDGEEVAVKKIFFSHIVIGILTSAFIFYHVFFRPKNFKEEPLQLSDSIVRNLIFVCGVLILIVISLLFRAPLGKPFIAGSKWSLNVTSEWYFSWLQFISERSLNFARIFVFFVVLLGFFTPLLMRKFGELKVRLIWIILIVILVIFSCIRMAG